MTYKRYVLSLDFVLEEDGKKIKVDRLGAATLVVPVLQSADGSLLEAKIRTEDFNHMADMVRQFIEEDNEERKVLTYDELRLLHWALAREKAESYKDGKIRDEEKYKICESIEKKLF